MKALYVLEGCDGAGKTTLADAIGTLMSKTGTKVVRIHYGPPDNSKSVIDTTMDPIREAVREHEEADDDTFLLVICDRFAVGDIVYDVAYRKIEPRTVPDDYTSIYTECLEMFDYSAFWYVRPELDVIKSRLAERGDDMITVDHVTDIYEQYDELILNQSELIGGVDAPWFIVTQDAQTKVVEAANDVRSNS